MRPHQMINGSLAEPLWLFSSKCKHSNYSSHFATYDSAPPTQFVLILLIIWSSFSGFLHLFSGCYGSLRCYVAESTSCGFLINFDSENAVENTVLLEVYTSFKQKPIQIIGFIGTHILSYNLSLFNFQVIELGTCRMLVLEECFRKTYNLSQRTTSLLCRENTNLLAVGSPVFVHRCICMFEVLMSRWRDEPAIQLTSIIRSMQDGVFMFDDTENF